MFHYNLQFQSYPRKLDQEKQDFVSATQHSFVDRVIRFLPNEKVFRSSDKIVI